MWYSAQQFKYKKPSAALKCKHDHCRHVLIAKDYMGDYDNRLTFWISGAGFYLMKDVMEFFHGKHLMKGYQLKMRHLPEYTYGKNYWYDTIFIDGLNRQMLSEDSLLQIIVHLLQKKAWCKVRIVSIQQLLNH